MAKVQQKSEKITAFGGIFFVLDKFDSILSSVIDSHLGLRSTLIGYQYSEIIRAIFSVFCCGGDCMEDLNLYLKDVLTERPHTRVPSADTVLRGIEELATENISYTAEKTGNVYDFNTAEKLNQLLIKFLLATGQLTEGRAYDVDFDHQLMEFCYSLYKIKRPAHLSIVERLGGFWWCKDTALIWNSQTFFEEKCGEHKKEGKNLAGSQKKCNFAP